MARVLAVNMSDTKGVVKKPIEKGYFEVDKGLAGDAHAGNWYRQVSLLAKESFDKLDKSKLKEDLCEMCIRDRHIPDYAHFACGFRRSCRCSSHQGLSPGRR